MIEPVPRTSAIGSSALRFNLNETEHDWKPQRLGNGKWACNHKCRDKTV